MGTPFDRAAERYIEEWVPRFVPYHLDLVRELALVGGQRVLVACAGPGAEVLAVARAVGERGVVHATDENAELVGICEAQAAHAGFKNVVCRQASPGDEPKGPYNAVICAFGLWHVEDRAGVLAKWAGHLAPGGKVGVLTFGPPQEDDPFELLGAALRELEPNVTTQPPRIDASREALSSLFDAGGLSLVRHTVLRHNVSFPSAEAFVAAIREGRTWRRVWDELGPERMGRVTARFFDRVGGPTAPLVFEPAATLAVAALPGEAVELANRPSVVAPRPSSPAPAAPSPIASALNVREPWDALPPGAAPGGDPTRGEKKRD